MFIEVKWISPSCKPRMRVTVSVLELACMRVWINMHAWVSATDAPSQHRPQCTVTGSGTNIPPAFTTWKHVWEKGRSSACVTKTSRNVHVCVSETHESCMFPCTKMRKQLSADCCQYSKVFTTRMRSSLLYCINKQNTMCATYYIHIHKHLLAHFFFFLDFFFASGVGFPLFPELFYFISKWSCSASGSLW